MRQSVLYDNAFCMSQPDKLYRDVFRISHEILKKKLNIDKCVLIEGFRSQVHKLMTVSSGYPVF